MMSISVSNFIQESLRSIWQERLVDDSWGIDPCAGPMGRVTATRGRMTSIV